MVTEGYRRIVVTGSAGGPVALPGSGHYVASKHGMVGLTQTVALEHAADGITANAVCPTTVQTPMVNGPQVFVMFKLASTLGAGEVQPDLIKQRSYAAIS
jgi:NAD(P)-dependent dehydrogenase (short-subunit alcohol dehydrogenase family)